MKHYAMIPARIGSTRLRMKNLTLLNGKPLIYNAIKAAQEAKVFDRIIINSDSQVFKKIADRYSIEFYCRPKYLGSSTTKSDEVVVDFITKNPCDILSWVNPIAPLQTGKQIKSIVSYFFHQKLDTLFTIKSEQVHCNFKNKPLNYSINEIFARTQDLEPIKLYVYSIMMWRTVPFIEQIKRKGHAFYAGKVGYYEVNKLSSFIIKDESDLMLAEYLIQAKEKKGDFKIEYDQVVEDLLQ